jgi:hypothetical protein
MKLPFCGNSTNCNLEVIEADPGVKGNTATNALKMQSLKQEQE